MNRRRLAAGGLGLLLFALAWASSDAAALLPVDRGVSIAGDDFRFVAALAILGGLVGLLTVLSGRDGAMNEADLRDPESPLDLPRAGDVFARAVTSRTALLPVTGDVDRGAVRDRLRRAAVDTVRRRRDCRPAEARRLVDRGAWTDDRHAASFLADGGRLPLVLSVRAWLTGRVPFQVGAIRTARAVVATATADGGVP
jgi:hypothetical protein